ncbi:hypothetical protein [Acetobacter ascendens]|nr:hypothetical protein [Acetobacter ascendens]
MRLHGAVTTEGLGLDHDDGRFTPHKPGKMCGSVLSSLFFLTFLYL